MAFGLVLVYELTILRNVDINWVKNKNRSTAFICCKQHRINYYG